MADMTNKLVRDEDYVEPVRFGFAPTRREFVQVLGAGLLIAISAEVLQAQARPGRGGGFGGRGGGAVGINARLHIGKDGIITVLVGKVEGGQGSRAELTQAAAEELHVPAEKVTLLMADTAQVPDDGLTAGSGTTPRTVPAVRQGAAAARELLIMTAAQQWGVKAEQVEMRDGKAVEKDGKRELTYAMLAADEKAMGQTPANVTITPVKEWKVLGTAVKRPNARDLVTGGHKYPSDITQPGMLYGKVLRAPSFGAKLLAVDVAAAKAMKDVIVVQDNGFVGVVAPTAYLAGMALEALEMKAKWERPEHPASATLFDYLTKHAREVPKNPFGEAGKSVKQTYTAAYVQHAPLEPRAACALWENGKLTVWTGSQNPFGVKGELERAFRLGAEAVRVIVPDFGGGFGGKHTGEAAVEAARLAQGAGKPVALRWTREEEFTWAYFRPAAVMNIEATLDDKGNISSWFFVNINAGQPGIETPYRIGKAKSQFVGTDAPLRQGSYRALASTANNFARESCMDELAALAGRDPLEFRLAHLENPRLKAVLQTAAEKFGWADRVKKKEANVGVGLACGTEKGSYVAACAEVAIEKGAIRVRKVCQAFECGAITNPGNLTSQNQGAIVMGLGPALREEMVFEKGVMSNASFGEYKVPRFADLPELEVHLLERPDLASTGAGETPIIVVAPAVANAVFQATGQRIRSMPLGSVMKA